MVHYLKAHFFQNDIPVIEWLKKHGFKSKHHPGQCKELGTFEKNLYNIVSSLKYRKSTDHFKEQRRYQV